MTSRKKLLLAVGAVVLVAVVIASLLGLRTLRYNRAVENWQQERYLESARDLYKLGQYRDAAQYRQQLEAMLMKSLTATSWRSEEAKFNRAGYEATGVWQFFFREDYTGTENHIATDANGSEIIRSDEFTYEFQCNAGRMMLVITYEAGQEAPYLLTVSEGSLGVEKFYGAFQFYEVYELVDYLPE